MARTPTFEGTMNRILRLEESIAKLQERLKAKEAEIASARSILKDLKDASPGALEEWAQKKASLISELTQ